MNLFCKNYRDISSDVENKKSYFSLLEGRNDFSKIGKLGKFSLNGEFRTAKNLVITTSRFILKDRVMRWVRCIDDIQSLVYFYSGFVWRILSLSEDYSYARGCVVKIIEDVMGGEKSGSLLNEMSEDNKRELKKFLLEIKTEKGQKNVMEGSMDEFLYKFIQKDVYEYLWNHNPLDKELQNDPELTVFRENLSRLWEIHNQFLATGALRRVIERNDFKGLKYIEGSDEYKELLKDAQKEKELIDMGIELIGGYLDSLQKGDRKEMEKLVNSKLIKVKV